MRPLPRLLASAMTLATTAILFVPSPAQALAPTAKVVEPVNSDRSAASITVRPHASVNLVGDYTLTWHLEKFDKPVSGRHGTTSGTLTDGETNPFEVDATGLPDGTYEVAGTLEYTGPGLQPEAGAFEVGLSFDRQPPNVTIRASRTELYPFAPNYSPLYANKVSITASGPEARSTATLRVRRPDGTTVRNLGSLNELPQSWNGRTSQNTWAPPGDYHLVAADDAGNETWGATVSVKHTRFEQRTWKRTVRADAALIRATVGRCSTVRKPSLRGWAGSLGLYTNTRCAKRTTRAAAISVRFGIKLPHSALWRTLTMSGYGGPAVARPSSSAKVSQLLRDGSLARTRAAFRYEVDGGRIHYLYDRMVREASLADRTMRWQVDVQPGHHIDVKNFTFEGVYWAVR